MITFTITNNNLYKQKPQDFYYRNKKQQEKTYKYSYKYRKKLINNKLKQKKTEMRVSHHFHENHNIKKDFKVMIFRSNIMKLKDRLYVENDLIYTAKIWFY